MKIPDKLIDEAIELQFKSPTQCDLDLFKQGVHCAEILMKDVAIEFSKHVARNKYFAINVNSQLFEQFIKEKYGE